MNWLQEKTSIYRNNLDLVGEPGTLEEVLFSGFQNNLPHIVELRKLDPTADDYSYRKDAIKRKLECFTPSALLVSRAKDNVIIRERTHLLQLDFDEKAVKELDIELFKRAVHKLSFVALSALSCSGRGFYSLVLIEEPERLKDYAEHCFRIFKQEYGIDLDTSKGRNAHDLRYISYDANMLVRENPIPLPPPPQPKPVQTAIRNVVYKDGFDPFKHAMKTAESKAGGTFQHGSNAHMFLFFLCCSLKGLNVTRTDAEEWINSNLIPLSQVKSNCIKTAYR